MTPRPTQRDAVDEAPASVPQTTPLAVGFGHPEYHFVQALMETQRSIGEVKAAVDALRVSVESTKSKVDDLVNWKNRILGGVLVLGALISIVGFLVAKFSDYITITAPAPQVQPTVVSMPTQPPPVPTHLPTGKK